MHVFADWYVHTRSFAGDRDAYFSMFDVLCIVWQVRPANQPRAQRQSLSSLDLLPSGELT